MHHWKGFSEKFVSQRKYRNRMPMQTTQGASSAEPFGSCTISCSSSPCSCMLFSFITKVYYLHVYIVCSAYPTALCVIVVLRFSVVYYKYTWIKTNLKRTFYWSLFLSLVVYFFQKRSRFMKKVMCSSLCSICNGKCTIMLISPNIFTYYGLNSSFNSNYGSTLLLRRLLISWC